MRNIKLKIFTKNGQSLLEVLVALGVVVLLVTGLSSLAVYALRSSQHAKNTETATRLAGEGIEQVRSVRDQQGWAVFAASPINNCYRVDTSGTPWALQPINPCAASTTNLTGFTRKIRLDDFDINQDGNLDADEASSVRKVTVTVFWTDSAGQNQVSSDTILTRWK